MTELAFVVMVPPKGVNVPVTPRVPPIVAVCVPVDMDPLIVNPPLPALP